MDAASVAPAAPLASDGLTVPTIDASGFFSNITVASNRVSDEQLTTT